MNGKYIHSTMSASSSLLDLVLLHVSPIKDSGPDNFAENEHGPASIIGATVTTSTYPVMEPDSRSCRSDVEIGTLNSINAKM